MVPPHCFVLRGWGLCKHFLFASRAHRREPGRPEVGGGKGQPPSGCFLFLSVTRQHPFSQAAALVSSSSWFPRLSTFPEPAPLHIRMRYLPGQAAPQPRDLCPHSPGPLVCALHQPALAGHRPLLWSLGLHSGTPLQASRFWYLFSLFPQHRVASAVDSVVLPHLFPLQFQSCNICLANSLYVSGQLN